MHHLDVARCLRWIEAFLWISLKIKHPNPAPLLAWRNSSSAMFFFYRSIEQKMAKLNWHDIILTWHETHAPMQSNIAFHFPLSHFLQPWNCKSSYEKGQIEDLQNWLERPSSENCLLCVPISGDMNPIPKLLVDSCVKIPILSSFKL